jgi:hypothetical protein
MILPRLGLFRANRSSRHGYGKRYQHVAYIDGETIKSVCIRQPLRNGLLIDPEGQEVTCYSCQNKGWMRSMVVRNATSSRISDTPEV